MTEVKNPDFGAVARAMGLYGERVEKAEDIRDAIVRAFDYPGPALIDFVTDLFADAPSPQDVMKRLEKEKTIDTARDDIETTRELKTRI